MNKAGNIFYILSVWAITIVIVIIFGVLLSLATTGGITDRNILNFSGIAIVGGLNLTFLTMIMDTYSFTEILTSNPAGLLKELLKLTLIAFVVRVVFSVLNFKGIFQRISTRFFWSTFMFILIYIIVSGAFGTFALEVGRFDGNAFLAIIGILVVVTILLVYDFRNKRSEHGVGRSLLSTILLTVINNLAKAVLVTFLMALVAIFITSGFKSLLS